MCAIMRKVPPLKNIAAEEARQYETERLKQLSSAPPSEIIAVSDLHLGRGRDPVTGRFVQTENFLSDQAFHRVVRYLQPAENKLLILNGDTFDFIRICNSPQSNQDLSEWSSFLQQLGVNKSVAELRASVSRKEKKYGLQTDDYKSTWKLLQMAKGHQEFIHALAQWIQGGGLLLMVKGNHDLDLYWPLVRKAFCLLLENEGAGKVALQAQMYYCDDSILISNAYLEHGHHYDPQQRMDAGPTLPDTPTQLTLPLATFVARYLINPLEKLEPFLGSLRPTERILWLLLRRYPTASLIVLFRSLRFLRRASQASRVRDFFWYAIYIASITLPFVTALIIAAIFLFVSSPGRIFTQHPGLSALLGLGGLFAPYIAAALREFVAWLGRRKRHTIGEDDMAAGVYCTLKTLPLPPAQQLYAIMGHTHDQDIQSLPNIGNSKVLYLNTGSWIPVWPDDRPDLAGQVLLPLVHLNMQSNGEYRHLYLEWRDDRGEPAESYILAPSSN
jgi:UDP-2,3-diacylglucosamine pyrophosphatase LpxH